ncbi:hypothetical protein ISF_08371 [Cordyceps fumosorosea ARSEF 2679]|uniref:C6 zinc finger domain protein n=1 Tax=Cordyceps fumosorosea (strain ARSEF 2679) TaxID=1081104 RepID=A0A167MJU4_CORFA|nr:hypothetical protein ISF_08371 [Cordyceps fumosorosea ARSEF 2679]OAA54443.1 hypothetical protein ISF_08371 [Cordyceps fumosorosea ARSEF 2679]
MTHVKAGQRRRAKAPKVRTGCRTCNPPCKVRRSSALVPLPSPPLPGCLHHACSMPNRKSCLPNRRQRTGVTTGRKCDGYEPQPETKPIRFVTLMNVTYPPSELRSFQYFQENTLSQLFTFIQEDMWTSHIIQTANMHQGIWHSVVAFSSFHENFLRHGDAGQENHDRFALKQYNMSIQSILGSERNSSNAHVHLISCILFICIEVLRGRILTVLQLLITGYAILKEERARSYSPYTESNGPSSRDRDALFAAADIFLSRIATQAYLLVKGIDPSLATMVAEILDFERLAWKERPTFHNLNQVQHALSTLRLELETYNQSGVGMVPVKLRWWQSAFDKFKKTYAEQLLATREGRRGLALMELQGLFVSVETAVFDGPPGADEDPLRWDEHTDAFREMLRYAELATEQEEEDSSSSSGSSSSGSAPPPERRRPPQFNMHIGVVPVLYGIIHKCRDPAIRRRAVALMSAEGGSQRRLEGVWDSRVVLAVALRAMAVEERGRPGGPSSAAEIPASARVRRIAVLPAATTSTATRQGDECECGTGPPKSYVVGYEIDSKWAWEHAGGFSEGTPDSAERITELG